MLQCCGKNVIDSRNYRCNDLHIVPVQKPTLTIINNINLPRYCGGAVPYESSVNVPGLCCRGLYYPNSDGKGKCCGSALFVPSLHACTNNIVYFVSQPVNSD